MTGPGDCGSLPTVSAESGFLNRVVRVDGSDRRYVVHVPEGYGPGKKWPAILFLHGYGESGTDGYFQMWHGVPRAILKNRSEWPFVCLFPQKPVGEKLWPTELQMLLQILDAVEAEFSLDPKRRYLTGLSQGGHGTIQLATKLSWKFAALAPVCGWADDPAVAAEAIGKTPLWAFHGDKDLAVVVQKSIDLVEAIQKRGGNAKLTRYPDVGHDSWHKAYQDEGLAGWFLKQSL